jgi:hypothetical protein
MKVITPTTITDGMYTSGPAETDYAAYNAATTYALGDHCIRTSTHRKYESLVASNVGNTPETSPTKWLDIGPTNKWALFDDVIGTDTTVASPLTVVIAPGYANALELLELVGSSVSVSMTSASEGGSVYSNTISLDASEVSDYYEYFFDPFVQRQSLVLTDLPPYADGIITVALSGSGNVSCGLLKVGLFSDLGITTAGVSVGIEDYSIKEKDAFGNTKITERSWSRRMSAKVIVQKADFARVDRKISDLRATPCVWIGSEDEQLSPLVVFGFPKSFNIELTYPRHFLCSLEIEGMT